MATVDRATRGTLVRSSRRRHVVRDDGRRRTRDEGERKRGRAASLPAEWLRETWGSGQRTSDGRRAKADKSISETSRRRPSRPECCSLLASAPPLALSLSRLFYRKTA